MSSSCPREEKNIYITSTNRDLVKFPYGNSYTLYLSTPIKDITKVELMYASIPNTVYNVNNGSNVIGFTDTSNITGNCVMCTLPVGFYGTCSMAGAVYDATQYFSNVSCSFIMSEGKFFFTRPTSFTMNVETQELASLLGFDFPCSIGATQASTTPYAHNLMYQNL